MNLGNKTNGGKNKKIMDYVAFLTFIDGLMTEKQDSLVNKENLQEMRGAMLKELLEFINAHLISLLNPKDQVDLSILLTKNPSGDDLDNFFSKRVDNYEPEVLTAMLNFKDSYLFDPKKSTFKPWENKTLPIRPIPMPPSIKKVN